MKKLILLLSVLVAGCSNKINQHEVDKLYHGLKTIEFEGCEYLVGWGGNFQGGPALTHKGNCKNHSSDTVYIPVPSENHSEIK